MRSDLETRVWKSGNYANVYHIIVMEAWIYPDSYWKGGMHVAKAVFTVKISGIS